MKIFCTFNSINAVIKNVSNKETDLKLNKNVKIQKEKEL